MKKSRVRRNCKSWETVRRTKKRFASKKHNLFHKHLYVESFSTTVHG